jgi:hypothetical protein
MSEPELTPGTAESAATADSPEEFSLVRFLFRELPYVAVLGLALFGVAYMNFSGHQINGFWEFLAIAMGLVCVLTAWPKARDRNARLKLIGTQAAHWATILVTMYLILLPTFQQLLPVPATGMVLLMVLALGAFLAGINQLSLRICFLGVAMALSVPAIAWLKQASLLLLLVAVAIVGLVIVFWPIWRGIKAIGAS